MAEKRMTDGSMALQEKQYRVITIEAAEKPKDIKLRVAAYARVSSVSDEIGRASCREKCTSWCRSRWSP